MARSIRSTALGLLLVSQVNIWAATPQKGPAFYTDVHGAGALIRCMHAMGKIDPKYKRVRDQAIEWFLQHQHPFPAGGSTWLQNPSAPQGHPSYHIAITTISAFNGQVLLEVCQDTKQQAYMKPVQENIRWLMSSSLKQTKPRWGDIVAWTSRHRLDGPARPAKPRPLVLGHSWGIGSTLDALATHYLATQDKSVVPYLIGGVRFLCSVGQRQGAGDQVQISWKRYDGSVVMGYCRGNAGTTYGLLKVAEALPGVTIVKNKTIEDVVNASLGLDAYKQVLGCDIDLVILATPPGFRPLQYRAAVGAGKHVFMEKPCCVDAGGYRSLIETNKQADEKGLKVGVGFFRRHYPLYMEAVERIQQGKLGMLSFLRCYANMPQMATRAEAPGMTEMQWQVNNWHVFDWIGGGRLVEMHCHGLDAMNWIVGSHPVEVNGMGGREVFSERRFGQDYDHHFHEFTYADGTKMYSQCRQMTGCWTRVTEHVHGTKDHIELSGFLKGINQLRGRKRVNAYQKEHIDLLDAIRNDTPYNEGWAGATSSFTAVIARMASYSGKVIKWDKAVAQGPDLFPKDISWDADPPVMPDKDGRYEHAVAVPGVYQPYS